MLLHLDYDKIAVYYKNLSIIPYKYFIYCYALPTTILQRRAYNGNIS